MTINKDEAALAELALESTLGAEGLEVQREIPLIDCSNFEERKLEIADDLWKAAIEVGFFQLINHDIDTKDVEQAFEQSEQFFGLSKEQKQAYPLWQGMNAGWEYMEQVRPSTGTADRKESYQITRPRMTGLWPDNELPEFQQNVLSFEKQCWEMGMKVLSCFAIKLGFEEDFFSVAHDPEKAEYQSTLRLLHYLETDEKALADKSIWRAGAHTDFDCLTLLFQKPGQGGLQVCPGKEANSSEWTSVEPKQDVITCNIGDMLMRWSDDQLKSTLHRVRMPELDEYLGPRYSIGFFCQANTDVVIQGPEKKYEEITAAEYLKLRLSANFDK